jgi:Protein of unknown function (DUF2855)
MITTLEVSRDDHARTRVVETPATIDNGQVLARIDRFSVTSNNVTYAVVGHTLGYWDFFPPADDGWGRVPAFGYAEIIDSRCAGVEVGTRIYGYLPMSSHIILEPGRISPHAFQDMAAHRRPMSEVYNRYALAATDPLHDGEREPQRMLLYPLFMTSFVIDDFFADNFDFGASTAVISSASSKTAIGVARLMTQRGLRVVGLTSDTNLPFTTSLGCYDELVTYDRIATLPTGPSVYIDISGSGSVRHEVHGRLGEGLAFSSAVGATAWEDLGGGSGPLPGPAPEFFFAPTQLQKRNEDWGRDEMDRRVLEAWTAFSSWTDEWMTIVAHEGADALAALWGEMFGGRVDPALGHVVRVEATPT